MPPRPLEAELEAAHARGEWRVPLAEIERRLTACRSCCDFLRHGCHKAPKPRGFVGRLVAEPAACPCWEFPPDE